MKPLKLERLFLKLACTYFSFNNCLLSTGVCVCVCVWLLNRQNLLGRYSELIVFGIYIIYIPPTD